MLLEFLHENAGLEALHVHGESKQFEVRLPLAFSKKKQFSKDRKDDLNRCRHPGCPGCPGGLAWAGRGEHWRI